MWAGHTDPVLWRCAFILMDLAVLFVNVLSVKILILDVSCGSFPKWTGTSFSAILLLSRNADGSTLDPTLEKGA